MRALKVKCNKIIFIFWTVRGLQGHSWQFEYDRKTRRKEMEQAAALKEIHSVPDVKFEYFPSCFLG